jgi:tetratricopeptide (TPR) repeat protein
VTSGKTMSERDAHAVGRPDAEEVRAALAHMAQSEAFRGSPQLVSFLRYVVEATLRGASDRIKGYTIAVEALGRAEDFDPQADPIVRVEAMRLRRALARYYANGGARDGVVIDVPLGSYVPVFRRAAVAPAAAPMLPEPPPVAALPMQPIRRRDVRPWSFGWSRAAAAVAFVLLGAAIHAGADLWLDVGTPSPEAAAAALAAPVRTPAPSRAAPAYPVVFVGRSSREADAPLADALRGKLRDALARFDEIEVVVAPPPDIHRSSGNDVLPGRYGLSASVEAEADGKISVGVRLTDAADGRVAYAHTFRREQRDGSAEDAVVRQVSAALAQPYGIIQAYERMKDFAGAGEGHYQCLIAAYDYWRSYDPQQHQRARDCLEHTTTASPGFALGFAALSAIVLEEHRSGVNRRPGDPPALGRALQAARRAVELKPGSARAHQSLADAQFACGDFPLALETGERALALNPYDPNVLAHHGAQLMALGDEERGARLIREAASAIVVRPAWHDFFLFLAAYLADDRAGASRHAALLTSDTYPLGLLAHALVAAQRGEAGQARQFFDRLAALRPGWRHDVRAEVKKYLPAESIVARISHDLGQIGHAAGQ